MHDNLRLQPNFQLRQPLPGIARNPIPRNIRFLVRTGTGDFYEDLDLRFTGPVQLARDGRLGSWLIRTDYNNFAPRLGIAYSPSSKWASAPGLTWGADYNLPTTYSMQYLFNIQRTIGANSTLEVGYTGNQSRKVAYLVNANAPIPGN